MSKSSAEQLSTSDASTGDLLSLRNALPAQGQSYKLSDPDQASKFTNLARNMAESIEMTWPASIDGPLWTTINALKDNVQIAADVMEINPDVATECKFFLSLVARVLHLQKLCSKNHEYENLGPEAAARFQEKNSVKIMKSIVAHRKEVQPAIEAEWKVPTNFTDTLMRSVNEHYKQHGNQALIAALAPVTSQHEVLKSISLGGVSGASWREGVAQSCSLKIFK